MMRGCLGGCLSGLFNESCSFSEVIFGEEGDEVEGVGCGLGGVDGVSEVGGGRWKRSGER